MYTLRMREISKTGLATCTAMASEGNIVCVLFVRSHYIYNSTWTSSVGEILAV